MLVDRHEAVLVVRQAGDPRAVDQGERDDPLRVERLPGRGQRDAAAGADRRVDAGAHVDAFRHCPMHPDAVVPAYRGSSDWRKPEPGMILDLLASWPVDVAQSMLVGDKPSDVEAGRRAGVASYRFEGGRLDEFIRSLQVGHAGA